MFKLQNQNKYIFLIHSMTSKIVETLRRGSCWYDLQQVSNPGEQAFEQVASAD